MWQNDYEKVFVYLDCILIIQRGRDYPPERVVRVNLTDKRGESSITPLPGVLASQAPF
jgi:hypothetical protein